MNRIAMMGPQLLPLAAMCGLMLASVAVSFLALWRARAVIAAGRRNLDNPDPSCGLAVELLKQEMAALQKQMQDTRHYPPPAAVPPPPRSGLNLDKRSQALRLHRRGEAPKQIAAILELPIQEVELLIKVHRIVLRSIEPLRGLAAPHNEG